MFEGLHRSKEVKELSLALRYPNIESLPSVEHSIEPILRRHCFMKCFWINITTGDESDTDGPLITSKQAVLSRLCLSRKGKSARTLQLRKGLALMPPHGCNDRIMGNKHHVVNEVRN